MTRTLLLVSILVLVCTVWAAADVVSGTVNVSRNSPTGGWTTVLLPMLDLTGGRTLTGIQIDVTSAGHAHFTASNDDGVDHYVDANFDRSWGLNDGMSWSTGDNEHYVAASSTLVNPSWDSGNVGYSGHNDGTFNPDVATYGSFYSAVGGGNLALNFGYAQTNYLAWVGTPPSSQSLATSHDLGNYFDLAIHYTYTYTEGSYVPEPTTWGLLAIGLVGLGFLRRRRSA